MATCSYVCKEKSGEEKLTLAGFSHGRLQRNQDGSWRKVPSFKMLRSSETEDSRKNLRRILVAEADSMQYVGQNYGQQASKANTMCKYMVGVLDKKSGKMKVYDAQLLELHPWLGKKEEKEEKDEESTELSYAEKKDRLTEAFGSSRKQRAMESRHKGRVGSEALETSAANALIHAGSLPSTLVKYEVEENDLLPPFDKTATRVQDIYKLSDLISPQHQGILQPLAEQVQKEAAENADVWKSSKKYSQYVLDHLINLPRVSERRRTTQAVCLLYMSYLMELHSLKHYDLASKTCLKEVPPIVRTHLLQFFTQMMATEDGKDEKRFLPKRLKDKLLAYILVIAQYVDSFHTDIGPLSQDLNIPVRRLIIHARAIGCKSTSQTLVPTTRKLLTKKKHLIKKESDDESDEDEDGVDPVPVMSVQKATFIELDTKIRTSPMPGGKRTFGGRR